MRFLIVTLGLDGATVNEVRRTFASKAPCSRKPLKDSKQMGLKQDHPRRFRLLLNVLSWRHLFQRRMSLRQDSSSVDERLHAAWEASKRQRMEEDFLGRAFSRTTVFCAINSWVRAHCLYRCESVHRYDVLVVDV